MVGVKKEVLWATKWEVAPSFSGNFLGKFSEWLGSHSLGDGFAFMESSK